MTKNNTVNTYWDKAYKENPVMMEQEMLKLDLTELLAKVSKYNGCLTSLSKKTGVGTRRLKYIMEGSLSPTLEEIAKIFLKLGYRINFKATKLICKKVSTQI